MKNVLHWQPPEGLEDDVLYRVKYKTYGTKDYHYKLECKDISKTWCDLSNETYDYEDQYYAKVRATWNYTCSTWAETDRFFPKIDTKIDPPVVNMYSGERSITINLSGPVKWKANPMDTVSFHDIYSLVQYKLAMLNNKTQQKVLHFSDETVFIPQEQVVINFISISVKDNALSMQKNMNCNLQDGTMQNIGISPTESSLQKRVQEEASDVNHLGYTSQAQQEPTFKMQQDVELPLQTPQGLHCAPVSNNESIQYGLIMKAEDFSSVQEQTEQYLKEMMPAAKNLVLYDSPNVLLNTSIAELEQAQWLHLQAVDGSPCLDLNNIQQEDSEEGEEEEYSTVVVDWDPQTKRLNIPNLSHFVSDREEEEEACTQRDFNEEEGLLSKLYKRQISEESPEDSDVYLTQFKDQWDLHVQMEE
ncbi:interleukin-20 receptor subunit alpha [Microcaecilia unicolor]|uniref:Interleukin-20 receptor subunit alpha n=1 Tax=Microcaecilia unicolor TaxID=1415580 RepID=A0A6P7XPB5_9AMPH|nr:interleukin-20 receptor subunit alpha [Microcaecilia unicolor]